VDWGGWPGRERNSCWEVKIEVCPTSRQKGGAKDPLKREREKLRISKGEMILFRGRSFLVKMAEDSEPHLSNEGSLSVLGGGRNLLAKRIFSLTWRRNAAPIRRFEEDLLGRALLARRGGGKKMGRRITGESWKKKIPDPGRRQLKSLEIKPPGTLKRQFGFKEDWGDLTKK